MTAPMDSSVPAVTSEDRDRLIAVRIECADNGFLITEERGHYSMARVPKRVIAMSVDDLSSELALIFDAENDRIAASAKDEA